MQQILEICDSETDTGGVLQSNRHWRCVIVQQTLEVCDSSTDTGGM